jgi:hypothetical protein
VRWDPDDDVLPVGEAVGVNLAHRLLLALASLTLAVGLVADSALGWAPFAVLALVWAAWAGADRLIRDVTAHPVRRPPAR